MLRSIHIIFCRLILDQGNPVNWTRDANGTTTLFPTIAEINQAEYAWGFEVRY